MLVDAIPVDGVSSNPSIVEIGQIPYVYEAFPKTTEFFSTWYDQPEFNPRSGRYIVSGTSMPKLARRLADPEVDLVVVHAFPSAPYGLRALARALFRRNALSKALPAVRGFGQQLVRGRVSAPTIVVDMDDPPVIDRSNLFLLDKAAVFFKRELPPDYWQVFMGTAHWRVPSARFRGLAINRERVAKIRPMSLGLPFGTAGRAAAEPVPTSEKTIDVFFAGRINNSSTQRERGLEELCSLRSEGYVIDVADQALSTDEYLRRCARSWLVWAPPGYGWQCFRTYEAAVCGSVPLLSHPTIEQYRPLLPDRHALYYGVEPGELTKAVRSGLADRERLEHMATAARAHVLTYHTPQAIARHMVAEGLRASA